MKKHRIGEISKNKQGLKMIVIAYRKTNDIDIEFEDGNIKEHVDYRAFKRGDIKNLFYPSVCGVGIIGNERTCDEHGKRLKSYSVWKSILERCYSKKTHKGRPTYINCNICEEWKYYKNFKEWFNKHYYEIEGENIQLDKDILIEGNKIYSPDTCIFVPRRINQMFETKQSNLPRGVYWSKSRNKYCARIRIYKNGNSKGIDLGLFDTIEEAEKVYNNARSKVIKDTAEEYKNKIPDKLYNRLIEISNNLR